MNQKKFARAVLWQAIAGVVLCAPPSFAQTEEAAIEEVLVTGTRIRQSPLDAPAPVMSLDADDLNRTGLSALADNLQRLPGMGSALNTKFNSSGNFGSTQPGEGVGAGAAQVNLRHLDAKRTLVLVDGIRWVNAASATGIPGAPDLNTIPQNIIERVEILQDGASAIYGSDAIGGVVNIITKKDFEGLAFDIRSGGFVSDSDGETLDVSATFGAVSERSSVMVSVGYVDQQEVQSIDRPETRFLFGLDSCIPLCSSATPQGRFFINDADNLARFPDGGVFTIRDGAVPGAGSTALTLADFRDFNSPADRFNFQERNLTVTPSERLNIFLQARYDITPDTTAYLRGLYNNRESTNRAAPEPIFIGPFASTNGPLDTLVIDATNPYNPFGCDISTSLRDDFDPATDCENTVFIARRPLEAGNRVFEQDVNTWYVATGLEGQFDVGDNNWFWDANVVFAKNRGDQIKRGGFIVSRLIQALGPVDDCVGAANGCVPFNIFGGQGDGSGTITQEMLDFVGFNAKNVSGQDLFDFTANVSGTLFELPAGPLGFAAGVEFRDQEGFFEPDAIVAAGDSNGVPAFPSEGEFDVTEVYGEIRLPLLRDAPGADLLEVSAAVRYTDYDFADSENTWKVGVLWRPFDDLSLRGSASTGLRAPTIGELFTSEEAIDEIFDDPCAGDRASTDPNVVAGCAAVGATDTFQPNEQLRIIALGNPDLEPETSDNFTLGATYAPSWVDNLDWVEDLVFDLNWYQIELDDAIRVRDAGTQLQLCLEATGRVALGDPSAQPDADFLCDGIQRNALGALARFESPLVNISSLETSGVDFSVTYQSPPTDFGTFGVSWVANFLNDFEEEFPINAAGTESLTVDRTGKVVAGTRELAFPELRYNLIVDWFMDKWSASVTFRYVDEVEERCATNGSLGAFPESLCSKFVPGLFDPVTETGPKNVIDDQLYTDVRLSWQSDPGDSGFTLTVGANNLFDEEPPLCTSCGLNNFNATLHDVPGVFGYVQVSYRN
ncbi:TonB-dependent receptor plug domain-containing protein [Exilibacterium tricleocarpae]|nr:TonB-dependent receptor [Exilibacterium tricleocarpae]